MSLRDGVLPSNQSFVSNGDIVPFGDCFAKCARNGVPQGDDIAAGVVVE